MSMFAMTQPLPWKKTMPPRRPAALGRVDADRDVCGRAGDERRPDVGDLLRLARERDVAPGRLARLGDRQLLERPDARLAHLLEQRVGLRVKRHGSLLSSPTARRSRGHRGRRYPTAARPRRRLRPVALSAPMKLVPGSAGASRPVSHCERARADVGERAVVAAAAVAGEHGQQRRVLARVVGVRRPSGRRRGRP